MRDEKIIPAQSDSIIQATEMFKEMLYSENYMKPMWLEQRVHEGSSSEQ